MSDRGNVSAGPRARGTQPLSPMTANLPGAPPPSGPPGSQAARDRAKTGPLPAVAPSAEMAQKLLEISRKKQQLRELERARTEAEREIARRQAELARLPAWKRFLAGVADTFRQAIEDVKGLFRKATAEVASLALDIARLEREVESLVKTGYQVAQGAVSDAVSVAKDVYEAGAEVVEDIGDAIEESAAWVGRKVRDYALGELALDGPDVYKDQGSLSTITNKLGVGDSVSITIEAGATIPLEEFAIPNAKLDGGGTLKLTRVPRTDASGNPVLEPKDESGNPPTELIATFEVYGRVGGSYAGKVGAEFTVEGAGHEVGLKASAGAEAEAGVRGRVAYSFRFDPGSAEDMDTLTGLVKLTAETAASQTAPGVGTILAGYNLYAQRDLVADIGRHLDTVEGEGGIYAQATANAGLGVGIFKAKPEAGGPKPGIGDQVEGKLLEKLKLDIAKAAASLGGAAVVGAKHDFRSGDNTVYVKLEGQIGASGQIMGVGEGAGFKGSRTAAIVYDQDGNLRGVKIIDETTKEHFSGVMTTVQDIHGRPIDPGLMATVGSSDTVRVTYDLRGEEVARIAEQMGRGGPALMLPYVQTLQMSRENAELGDRSVVAYHRDTFGFKFGFQLDLGAQIGIRFKVEAAHDQEVDLSR